MIHQNKNKFIDVINMTVKHTGFRPLLLEKDYYLTLMLSKIHDLSKDLIFKGGTCINKIYYSYYRLSEDLDFNIRMPVNNLTRNNRRKYMQPIKDNIAAFAKQFGMWVDATEEAGRNESKQYIYYLRYKSVVQPQEQFIKLEIGLRFNPLTLVERKPVQHKFIHPFTREPLFDGGFVNCFSLKEIVSEKLRAAALRRTIAPRDFYDLDFIIRNKFDFADREVMELFKKKLREDYDNADLMKYRINMGRGNEEIDDMRSRIEAELFDVLSPVERKNFDLDKALMRINAVMKSLQNL